MNNALIFSRRVQRGSVNPLEGAAVNVARIGLMHPRTGKFSLPDNSLSRPLVVRGDS
jgi:hypothetical protein